MRINNEHVECWALQDDGGNIWVCSIAYHKRDCIKLFLAFHDWKRKQWKKAKANLGLKHIKIIASFRAIK